MQFSRGKRQKKSQKKNNEVSFVRKKEFAMKDGNLKLYWKTIEKVKPSTRSEHWKYEKCSDAFKHEEHYVGMSEVIKNVKNNYVNTITPAMVDKVLKIQATLGNGAQEIVSDE
eukprot:6373642-Ditylum_brightwellii.AAC.1